MVKQRNSRHASPEQLKREILEGATRAQDQARSSLKELDRQGDKLRLSLDDGKNVAEQTVYTGKAISTLIDESRAKSFFRYCCCCIVSDCCRSRYIDRPTGIRDKLYKNIILDTEDTDYENINIDRLKKMVSRKNSNRNQTWMRTLGCPLDGKRSQSDIWYQQLDVSLNQLEQTAQDMARSLDEQIKLAQMLTIYLNYGVDQVIKLNENLATEKALL